MAKKRTPEQIEKHVERVYKAVKSRKKPVSAADVVRRTKLDSLHVRDALQRLCADGRVTWTGKTSGTRYSAR